MANKTPLFSIVIANYNHGHFLEEAILSIINQGCTDYELIIIDGGSTDDSLQIIEKYREYFFYAISEKDKGQSDAFNKGFEKATGEYYLWINADDTLLPNALQHAKSSIKNDCNTKWFVANTIFIDKHGKILLCSRGPKWHNFLIKNNVPYVYGPTSIFHHSIFNQVKGFDLNLHYMMDADLWIKFIKMGVSFKRIDKYFWSFRVHDDSKTSPVWKGARIDPFEKEQNYMLLKNSYKYLLSKRIIIRLYKIITFLYAKSYFDTLRYKNKLIANIRPEKFS